MSKDRPESRRPLPEDAPLPPHLNPRALPPHLDPRGPRRRSAGSRKELPREQPRSREPQRVGVVPRPPRRGLGRRIALGVLVVFTLFAVTGLGTLVWANSRIERVEVAPLGEGAIESGTTYLLVGTDSREGLTPEELAEARTTAKDGDTGTLTDTILLVHIPAGGGNPTVVSFPRDSFVEVPGAGRRKINSAYAIGLREGTGGPAKLVSTVQNLTGLAIDHYLEVGFISFLRITDAIGGIEVNLCQAVRDPDSGIDLPAGPQELDGGDALAFVRQRKGLPRGDLDRAVRQQYFLGAVADKVLSPSTLLRPDRLFRLVGAVTSSITADEGLSVLDLARLGWALQGSPTFATVPVADPAATRGGASVVLLDEQAIPGFFARVADGEPVAAPQPRPLLAAGLAAPAVEAEVPCIR